MTLCHANQSDVSQTRCSSDADDGVSLETLASIAILLTLAAAQLVTLLLYEKRHI